MNKQISLYLDLVRFLAAIIVLISHLNFDCFYNIYPLNFEIGVDAVIIFFVLSGYVIAYVVDTKEKDIKDYLISRFSRLYSVLIPAVILTFILDKIGYALQPDLYGVHIALDRIPLKIITVLTFTNQLWLYYFNYLSNAPLWSLGYEFWYYILFAFAFFIKNKKLKYTLLVLTSLFIGPKILILMPIWTLGIFIYHLHKNIILNKHFALFAFLSSFILILLFIYIFHYVLKNPVLLGEKFFASRKFLMQYLLGIIIALNFLSVKYIKLEFLNQYENIIRNLASTTFSIYLYHLPLLFFYGAILRHKTGNLQTLSIMTILTLFSIFVLAQFTEKKKHVFKKYIIEIYDFIASLATLLFSSSGTKHISEEIQESESKTTA